MRTVMVAGVVALVSVWTVLPATAQGAADAPAFAIGTNKAYCHAATDGLTAWMNALPDDGDGTTYNVFGEPAFVDPVNGIGFDPVQDADFEIRIPLSPAPTGFIVSGTVNVQAFLGSGAYGGGQGTVGASLAVDGTEIGAAEPVDHTMQPHNSNLPEGAGPYEEVSLTFEVPETPVPAGGLLEWIISGHIDFGNNIFLSCFENRGRSNIDIPVLSLGGASPGGDGDGNSTTNTTTSTSSSASSSSASSSSASTSQSSSSTSTSETETSSSSTSTNATDGDAKDSPAPPLAWAALAVLVAAFVARRRLR